MIVRMWHGRVPTAKAAAYRAFLNARAIPDYRSVPGNIAAIVGFAGADVEVEFEPNVVHYEVVGSAR